jgi:sensor histidine kinase YesM
VTTLGDSSIIHVLQHPNENGISVFILGFLFVLTLYHFMLYFQHKDKTYLYYSLYTFLIFTSHLIDAYDSFIEEIIPDAILIFLDKWDYYLMWTYNIVYFIFAFTYIDLKSASRKWYKIIFHSVNFLLILTFIIALVYYFSADRRVILYGNFLFLALIVPLALISYIPLFKSKSPIKYYVIIGGSVLFITSISAELIFRLGLTEPDNHIRYSIFYSGLIIENLFFSLGLGQKQKLILQEKNESQIKLIYQLRENENLKETINEQLALELTSLSKQAEIDKLDSINAIYEKELAELKLTLLRSQMNPHFIFNSLNSIKLYIINNEKENAVYYLNKFSKLIRKILASTQIKENSLADELETMDLYMNIENIRFENRINYIVELDKTINVDTIKLPCMILQPILENAIWHGLSSKKGDIKLKILIRKLDKKHIEIQIEDNGIGRKNAEGLRDKKVHKKSSFGLRLTKERLANFYKEYANKQAVKVLDLVDEKGEACGTRVEIKIPLL